MKNFAFLIYRKWAFDIFLAVVSELSINSAPDQVILIATPNSEYDLSLVPPSVKVYISKGSDNAAIAELIASNKIDVAFFYGWSWIVDERVLNSCICLCLHPSMLPLYRGGTPLQHQIIAGEEVGGVTIFQMQKGIDNGDIYRQRTISLIGTLDDIFIRIVCVGIELTTRFVEDIKIGPVTFIPQIGLDTHKVYPRRRAEQSEILKSDLLLLTRKNLINKIRALATPYPNAYIQFNDGKLVLEIASIFELDEEPLPRLDLDMDYGPQGLIGKFIIATKDGEIKISAHRFESL